FKALVDSGEIKGISALDLGCGTGIKSIYLIKHGFKKVLGIDIALKAIEIAKKNAEQEKVSDQCNFLVHDITDWKFINNNEKFDFVLDWAALHCIEPSERVSYAQNIEKHTHKDSLVLVRSFSAYSDEKYFEERVEDEKSNIYFISISEIEKLFPAFKIIKQHESLPRTKSNIFFTEVLMKRI
ncbi:MAG: class I SAM-dependent methyltransferase, partial [Minisyncoccia bacterium]